MIEPNNSIISLKIWYSGMSSFLFQNTIIPIQVTLFGMHHYSHVLPTDNTRLNAEYLTLMLLLHKTPSHTQCIVFYWLDEVNRSIVRSNSTSDCTLALPVQRYTMGHRLTLPRRSQTCHQYFCSRKMLKVTQLTMLTEMLPQIMISVAYTVVVFIEHHLKCFVM